MAETLNLQVATPERQLVNQAVKEVELPGRNGHIGVLPDHAPLLGMLGAGQITYSGSGERRPIVVSGGFIEILNNEVRVLAERADFANEIDAEEARRELAETQKAVDGLAPDANVEQALEQLKAAQARVDAAERGK
jgi:F-type H+-transporting ATPase subunit epsilon